MIHSVLSHMPKFQHLNSVLAEEVAAKTEYVLLNFITACDEGQL